MPHTQTTDYALARPGATRRIVVDRWGIPHIRAATRHDVFFVQGFNAARDRLWQLDTWRKRGLGRLAADYGPGFLAQDRAARLFLYRGDMAAEYAAYGIADAEAVLAPSPTGINAWIALTERTPACWRANSPPWAPGPERFAAGGRAAHPLDRADAQRAPPKWRAPRSGPRRRAGGTGAALAGAGLDPDRARGPGAAAIPPEVLDVYRLGTADFNASPDRLAAPLAEAWRWSKVTDLGDVYAEGSNNWAVAASRTASGRPILASDPHRAHALPGLRYIVHLTGAGLDVDRRRRAGDARACTSATTPPPPSR